MATTVMEHSRFFCYMAKQIESHKGITNIRTVEKVMPQQISSNGFASGCFLAYAVLWRHKAFNLHTFRPYYFSQFSEKSGCFTSGQRADILASWYIFRYQLKKGNTGGHGASQGQENCGERAEGNNSRINSSVCLKMMAGFYLHRFVPGSFSEENLEMA